MCLVIFNCSHDPHHLIGTSCTLLSIFLWWLLFHTGWSSSSTICWGTRPIQFSSMATMGRRWRSTSGSNRTYSGVSNYFWLRLSSSLLSCVSSSCSDSCSTSVPFYFRTHSFLRRLRSEAVREPPNPRAIFHFYSDSRRFGHFLILGVWQFFGRTRSTNFKRFFDEYRKYGWKRHEKQLRDQPGEM